MFLFQQNFFSKMPLWQQSQNLLFGILKFRIYFLRQIEIFVNMGPYGSKNFKTHSYCSLSTKRFLRFPVTILTKLAYWQIQISNVKF